MSFNHDGQGVCSSFACIDYGSTVVHDQDLQRTAFPVQCSEMEVQQRDGGAANWMERVGGRNSQTVNLRPGRRARPREHDERIP